MQKLNHTQFVLIPKIASPQNITQWRPISLCNVAYKIISKVLTYRLERVVNKVISINQYAFVANRQITENIFVVHEILHSMKRWKGKEKLRWLSS